GHHEEDVDVGGQGRDVEEPTASACCGRVRVDGEVLAGGQRAAQRLYEGGEPLRVGGVGVARGRPAARLASLVVDVDALQAVSVHLAHDLRDRRRVVLERLAHGRV